jgi:hypothetical protein
MKKIFYLFFLLSITMSCIEKPQEKVDAKKTNLIEESYESSQWFSLTVAESKRLIAKGIANYPPVKEKMKSGSIIIARGTTNSYIAEELLGIDVIPGEFVTGRIKPKKNLVGELAKTKVSEMVVVDGKYDASITYKQGLLRAKEGDIIFKGANLVNPSLRQAATCIGSPTGGTVGAFLPFVKEKNLRVIIPVGLEKQVSYDLNVLSRNAKNAKSSNKKVPLLNVYNDSDIFTEIEAIKTVANVDVFQIASGGVLGAEGAVSLVVRGDKEEVDKAMALIESVQGELPFKK